LRFVQAGWAWTLQHSGTRGELGFFDNNIIPLAKKLKECNVFGVSSDEYLNYALQNQAECGEEDDACDGRPIGGRPGGGRGQSLFVS
jgi:hypothetical protein